MGCRAPGGPDKTEQRRLAAENGRSTAARAEESGMSGPETWDRARSETVRTRDAIARGSESRSSLPGRWGAEPLLDFRPVTVLWSPTAARYPSADRIR
jgi:hypothetical protein